MEELKIVIQNVISQKPVIDWLIVHDISKAKIEIAGIEFSFVDGKERRDEPFKTNQGYISLNTPSIIKQFWEIVTELTEEFISNPMALSNLFITVTRASYNGEEKETLIKNFKKQIGKDSCKDIFNLLITSLNSEYYKDSNSIKTPLKHFIIYIKNLDINSLVRYSVKKSKKLILPMPSGARIVAALRQEFGGYNTINS